MWGQPRAKCINFIPFSTSSHGFPRRAIGEVDTDSESSVSLLNFQLGSRDFLNARPEAEDQGCK